MQTGRRSAPTTSCSAKAARRRGADRGAMSATPVAEQAACIFAPIWCAADDFPRYGSTLFAPSVHRPALLALYAFNVEIARMRDQVQRTVAGRDAAAMVERRAARRGHGGVEGNPVAAALLRTIGRWRLPVDRLCAGRGACLRSLQRSDAVAGGAGRLCQRHRRRRCFRWLRAFWCGRRPAIDHVARHAGLAYGMAQAITALPLHAARRQLFVPLQLLESHGSGLDEVFAGKQTPEARAAIDQLIGEARQHLDTALALLADVPADVRPAFLPLALVRRDLKRMSRADSDPFMPRRMPRVAACCGRCGGRHARRISGGD